MSLFNLSDSELSLFDCIAKEFNQIIGTKIDYFSLDVERSDKDPLYDEPITNRFKGPFSMHAYIEYPEPQPEAGQSGLKTRWSTSMWISRKAFEETRCPVPFIGDVIRVWETPFFDDSAVDDVKVPGAGFYFDVTTADNDGHLFDTPSFVGFKLRLLRRTEFTTERRLDVVG